MSLINLFTDCYKVGHIHQYHPNMTLGYSNYTNRNNKFAPYTDKVVLFGVQGLVNSLKTLWDRDFFNKPLEDVMTTYKEVVDHIFGKDKIDTEPMHKLHKLGYLPIEIKSLPEGSLVPVGVPVLTIKNTHDDFAWLVNYLESYMSCNLWKTITNATNSYAFKRVALKYADKTCDNNFHVPYQVHDFSFRGMSGVEDAMSSGAAHLLSFLGSDTIPAYQYITDNYGPQDNIMCSVPASEHSVATSHIIMRTIKNPDMTALESEREFLKKFIAEIYPDGICSYVADSFDYWGVISDIVPSLKDEIMARNGALIVRPDSGTPTLVVCGNPNGETEVERKGSIEALWDTFGGTINSKGYKVLDPHIGLIYGDSITLERFEEICEKLEAKGFASSNFVVGKGSYTAQYITRDTFGGAMKQTYCEVDGVGYPIFKAPKTDSGKNSAKGLLRVELVDGNYKLFDNQTWEQEQLGELNEVFYNGHVINSETFEDVRNRLNSNN